MDFQSLLVLCTHPNALEAQILAEELVDNGLAACINIMPQFTSVYRWEDSVQVNSEILLLIKTTQHRYNELESYLKRHHPYECPEIIATPITLGEKNYLNWLHESTMP